MAVGRCNQVFHFGSDEPLRQGSVADHFQVDLSGDFAVELHRDAVLAGAMDFGHQDVAAINFLLGGVLDGFCHVTVGDRAEQHVVFAGLLLHGEATDGVQGRTEVKGRLLQGRLAFGFLGAAVLNLLHHCRRHRDRLAEWKQEVAGITGGDLHQVSVLAEAEDVLIQNDLNTLWHGTRGRTLSVRSNSLRPGAPDSQLIEASTITSSKCQSALSPNRSSSNPKTFSPSTRTCCWPSEAP